MQITMGLPKYAVIAGIIIAAVGYMQPALTSNIDPRLTPTLTIGIGVALVILGIICIIGSRDAKKYAAVNPEKPDKEKAPEIIPLW